MPTELTNLNFHDGNFVSMSMLGGHAPSVSLSFDLFENDQAVERRRVELIITGLRSATIVSDFFEMLPHIGAGEISDAAVVAEASGITITIYLCAGIIKLTAAQIEARFPNS